MSSPGWHQGEVVCVPPLPCLRPWFGRFVEGQFVLFWRGIDAVDVPCLTPYAAEDIDAVIKTAETELVGIAVVARIAATAWSFIHVQPPLLLCGELTAYV